MLLLSEMGKERVRFSGPIMGPRFMISLHKNKASVLWALGQLPRLPLSRSEVLLQCVTANMAYHLGSTGLYNLLVLYHLEAFHLKMKQTRVSLT